MDIEYLGPTRYDYGDSDSDSEPADTPRAPPITVRLKRSLTPPTTLVLSPYTPPHAQPLGLIHTPVNSPTTHPLGLTPSMTQSPLFQLTPATMHLSLDPQAIPLDLLHPWVLALCSRVGMRRIVVVSCSNTADQRFRSPAVLAGKVVTGLPAAVMNYADARGIPCRHVVDKEVLLSDQEIDALFASPIEQDVPQDSGDGADTLSREVSAALYV
ncbi:hypothetical protein GGI15_002031 [Coemansia interrupta]|uniref:Uncharacterized protein n=1 Tax=Coemansia interrupta TaxID=1126814 RepID=A0A9W8HHF9_9FUNG|nr:hypothetical protein GGI15_002031 [Coemansia interrupta]